MKNPENYKHSDLTQKIIKEAYHVYNTLGYGFLEKVYENALYKRLTTAGLTARKQHPIKVYFEDELVGEYAADILVEDKVIIELKAVEEIHPAHEAQLVNYLKATAIEIGLLINFGPKISIKRRIFSQEYKNQREPIDAEGRRSL